MQKWRLKRRFHIRCEFTPEIVKQLKSHGTSELYVLSMYDYYLPQLDTNKVAKVVLDFGCDNVFTHPNHWVSPHDILVVPVTFSIDEYVRRDSLWRKQFLLACIHQQMLELSKREGWSTVPFEQAYSEVVEREFHFGECWMKSVWNAKRTRKAQVCWEFEDKIRVTIRITGAENKDCLISVLPAGLAALPNILGKLNWLDDRTVRLEHSNKRDAWLLDVISGQLDFFYPRAVQGDPHGMYDLGIMYLEGREVLADTEKAVQWISASAAKNYKRAILKLSTLE